LGFIEQIRQLNFFFLFFFSCFFFFLFFFIFFFFFPNGFNDNFILYLVFRRNIKESLLSWSLNLIYRFRNNKSQWIHLIEAFSSVPAHAWPIFLPVGLCATEVTFFWITFALNRPGSLFFPVFFCLFPVYFLIEWMTCCFNAIKPIHRIGYEVTQRFLLNAWLACSGDWFCFSCNFCMVEGLHSSMKPVHSGLTFPC